MSQTTFSGPVISGDKQAGVSGGPNTGYAVLSQAQALIFGATLVQDYTFYVPPSSQIIDIIIDITTAYNSATSATASAGISTGATDYVSGVNVKTTGRKANSYSAAQLAAMVTTGTGTTVVVTVTSVGQPSAGAGLVRLEYVQTTGA